VTICSNVPLGRAPNLVSPVAQRRGLAQEIRHPKAVREEVFGERLDEDAIIVPDGMETGGFFGHNDLATFDPLTM
jgi:hypothetical protein